LFRGPVIKLGVVGSRRRNDPEAYNAVKAELIRIMDEYPVDEEFVLVSGGCSRGADSFVKQLSTELGLPEPIEHLPLHSKGSPYWEVVRALKQRNTKIADDCDILVATPAPDRSGGTEDTINKATRFNKEVRLV
jgi:hypothetical protein